MKNAGPLTNPSNGALCADCGNPSAVGLNGAWLCLIDFNNRLAREAEKLRELVTLAKLAGRS